MVMKSPHQKSANPAFSSGKYFMQRTIQFNFIYIASSTIKIVFETAC